jgi:hypothetical protein
MTMTQHWKLETDAAGIAWLCFDKADAKANVLASYVIQELNGLLDELEQSPPKGLVLYSGKPGSFIMGADITEFSDFGSAEEVARLGKMGQGVFRRFEALPCPTVARSACSSTTGSVRPVTAGFLVCRKSNSVYIRVLAAPCAPCRSAACVKACR